MFLTHRYRRAGIVVPADASAAPTARVHAPDTSFIARCPRSPRHSGPLLLMAGSTDAPSTPAARIATVVVTLVALGLCALSVAALPGVAAGTYPTLALEWVPALNVSFAFRFDGLSMLFALLITGIGALVVPYAASYLAGHRSLARLQWTLLAFMLAMLGLVTADDIMLLFVFWELTTITSFLLVGFDHENPTARRAALQALVVTGAGGLAMLAGLVLLGEIAGTYRLSEILASDTDFTAHAAYPVILTLVLLGAFTKSAQFPFHFWLPGAMAAPTPVSAYLHSATMVKAGIYLLARTQPALGGTDAWFFTLTSVGAVTAVWSSMMALRQTDAKLMLAWTTVMALGTLTLFLGSSERIAVLAAMTFLLVHALYKCALFLVIGNVDHGTGTREIDRLGGLVRALPVTAFAAFAAAFSMAGFPPFLGFIGKELKYEGALAIADEPWPFAGASLLANSMMVAVALIIVVRIFVRGRTTTDVKPHEAPLLMWLPPLLLAAAGLVAGIFPELVSSTLLAPAVEGIRRTETTVYLSLWHGVNVPLMMSIATVALGTGLFLTLARVRAALSALVVALRVSGDSAWDAALDGCTRGAAAVTARLQSGSLGRYLAAVFAAFALATGLMLGRAFVMPDGAGLGDAFAALGGVPALPALVAALMIATTAVVAFARSRLLGVAALGGVGAGVALLFLSYGAVDVAITQLMVETLFVVLIAAVLPRLPRFSGVAHPGKAGGARDAAIAVACGLVVALTVLLVATLPLDVAIPDFYAAASYDEAYGRNIVNVILVDFRALDTLGEVAVVVAAALAVVALATGGAKRVRGAAETRA